MAWLYVPSAYVPASAVSISDCVPDLTAHIAQSVTWRETPIAPRFWQRAWRTGILTTRLSGLTCEPSTLSHGVELWISSLQATPAPRSPMRAIARALKILGTFGRTSLTSWRPSVPPTCSARTSQDTSPWVSEKSSTTYRAWVTQLRRESLARQKLARTTCASDFILLPTPNTCLTDGNSTTAEKAQGLRRYTLVGMARRGLWPTPTASGNYNRKGASEASGDGLATVIAQHTPGLLNPQWVEWLMGYPIGWTDLKPLATPLSQPQLNLHGEL